MAHFLHEVLKVEGRMARRLLTLANFHFVGAAVDGLVGAGFGYHFCGLEEHIPELQARVEAVPLQGIPDLQQRFSCYILDFGFVVEDRKLTEVHHNAPLEGSCRNVPLHPPHSVYWKLSKGRCLMQVSEVGGYIHQSCVGCTYSIDVPQAYGHNNAQQLKAWREDQEVHLHKIVSENQSKQTSY